MLFGSTKAHRVLRRMLVEDQRLDGIVSRPSGVFKPYARVSTAILLFTKTNSGGTDDVRFYDLKADSRSLDDKRTPLLDVDKLGVHARLTEEEHKRNNLPDVLARWRNREGAEVDRERTAQSFTVPKAEIAENDYDLSLDRYAEIVYEEVEYPSPTEILDELDELETELQKGLVGMNNVSHDGSVAAARSSPTRARMKSPKLPFVDSPARRPKRFSGDGAP